MTGDDAIVADEPTKATHKGTDWAAEARGIFWLVLAVLGFHSFIAKPFYIPSESMMPGLLKGDRLVVTKYPYGYSFVSPTFHLLPFTAGRLFGRLPERGDVVIVVPPGVKQDYIKRVIGLPGDRIELREGVLILNGASVKRGAARTVRLPLDANVDCPDYAYPGALEVAADGAHYCNLPVTRETLPNGRYYDTVVSANGRNDSFAPITIPAGRVFLMGDNRGNSADSRVAIAEGGLGGPVPWENLGGRAEFITFSLDGSASWNPFTWPASLRGGRAGGSLHPAQEGQ